jgi:hypothetical protein
MFGKTREQLKNDAAEVLSRGIRVPWLTGTVILACIGWLFAIIGVAMLLRGQ